jgi:hypothetical protein
MAGGPRDVCITADDGYRSQIASLGVAAQWRGRIFQKPRIQEITGAEVLFTRKGQLAPRTRD